MDTCKDIINNDCTTTHDLKRDVLQNPSKNCVTENIDLRKNTVEDTNCNLTLVKSKKLPTDEKHNSSSCSNDKPNVIGLHVGPNGLVNGLEIDSSATLSRTLDKQIVESENCDNLCATSSSQNSLKQCCEINTVKRPDRINQGRTAESISSKSGLNSEICSAANCSSQSFEEIQSDSSHEKCKPKIAEEPSNESDVQYVSYLSELQMPDIMRLIQKDLSEPYSIYTYRYFIHNWPKLCFLAMDGSTCIGAIVCKLDTHRKVVKRGYIAMLAVDEKYRKRKIGSNLVLKAIRAMVADDADEVVLETEITNRPALRLYENLGFVRDKRLFRYYLNGVDALRLKLWLR